jgi:hypothetical protein
VTAGRSRRIAATVIKIAAGTKNDPIERIAIKQHAHRRTAATTAARREGRTTAIRETTTGIDETNRIHEPLTANPEVVPHRSMSPSLEHWE